jgi:hypothetical protein
MTTSGAVPVTVLPSGAAGLVGVPLAEALISGSPGAPRSLSDLTRACRPGGHARAYLADAAAARASEADPVLYTAYRDVLPPRLAAGST